jgi:hypothetical protein
VDWRIKHSVVAELHDVMSKGQKMREQEHYML